MYYWPCPCRGIQRQLSSSLYDIEMTNEQHAFSRTVRNQWRRTTIMSHSPCSVAGRDPKKQLMGCLWLTGLVPSAVILQRHGQCHGDTTWDGDFGMLAPGASKVDGSSSWFTVLVSGLVMGDPSGGGEGLLFAFAGVLSLKEVEREREREGKEKEREVWARPKRSCANQHRSVASIISLLCCPDTWWRHLKPLQASEKHLCWVTCSPTHCSSVTVQQATH